MSGAQLELRRVDVGLFQLLEQDVQKSKKLRTPKMKATWGRARRAFEQFFPFTVEGVPVTAEMQTLFEFSPHWLSAQLKRSTYCGAKTYNFIHLVVQTLFPSYGLPELHAGMPPRLIPSATKIHDYAAAQVALCENESADYRRGLAQGFVRGASFMSGYVRNHAEPERGNSHDKL